MDEARALAPLACGGCGAPLVLADADEVTCAACGAHTPVPALHREALRAEHQAAELRRAAGGRGQQLGATPSRAMRILGGVFATKPRLVLGALWVFGTVGFLTVLGVVAVEAIAHVDVFMSVPTQWRDRVGIPLWFALTLLVVWLGVYGQRRAVSLRAVQAALAARPPSTPGGPASCRHCGALLAIAADALDVRCIYCGTDNLVALPAAWVTGVAASSRTAGKALADATTAFAAQRARLRNRMWISLGFYGVFVGGMFALAALSSQDRDPGQHHDPRWWEHAGDPRELVRRRTSGAPDQWSEGTSVLTFAADCAAHPAAIPLEPRDCTPAGCTMYLYAALRTGERATITSHDAGTLAIEAPRWFAGWTQAPDDEFGRAATPPLPLAAGAPTTFTADWQTWYQLKLTVPGPPHLAHLCFAVAR